MNGCFNRPALRYTVVVQDGWQSHAGGGWDVHTRSPVMRTIPDPMSKDCQYSILHKSDPKCEGCKWQHFNPNDGCQSNQE